MGIFGFGKKKKDTAANLPASETTENQALDQNLNNEAQYGGIYNLWLLFREKAAMPRRQELFEKLRTRFGNVDTVSDSDGIMSFAIYKYSVTYENGQTAPAQLMLFGCNPAEPSKIADDIARSQFWE
jgi:hypothetical protein